MLSLHSSSSTPSTLTGSWSDLGWPLPDVLDLWWTGSDGAAGRMTASGGLHNMPAEMRWAVVAEPGHIFVRVDPGRAVQGP